MTTRETEAAASVEYLTPEELVARWKNQVTTRTLANWRVELDKGPAFVKIGSRVLYELAAVVKWEQSRQQRQSQRRGA